MSDPLEGIEQKIADFFAAGGTVKRVAPVSTVAQVKAAHPGLKDKILGGVRDNEQHGIGYAPDEKDGEV